ncbi:MAG TPA: TIGR03560 family F420-dependent LLM class oxidoreductase [Streptosporangiaceae bacterium]|nr:TIGR03560 family F420-dependent LLM class oxidoreductase [Streptosporangiaceae bacterium]
MELHIFTDPQQGASYEDLLATAVAAQQLGFDGFFRSDHYLPMGPVAVTPGPTDAWLSLAALARETARIRLGTLVTAVTFRLPGPLAIAVAQVDRMSGGRVDFGFGAGGYPAEHLAYGIPFPAPPERFDQFEEQLAIITGLWRTPDGETFSYRGRHYELIGCPGLAQPTRRPRPHPPIIIGGRGPSRTPSLAARYAAEFNCAFPDLAQIRRYREGLVAACVQTGRDPFSLAMSALVVLACGPGDARVRELTQVPGFHTAGMIQRGLVGTPAQVTHRIGEFAEAGISRLYLATPRQFDIEQLAYVADQVMPQVAGR